MTSVQRWIASLRVYSFPASAVPVVLAMVLAGSSPYPVLWWAVPVYAAAALLFHAGTNVLNDYYDYLHGVDRPEDDDPTHAITRGIVTPRFMMVSGHLYFIAAVILGSSIALIRGPAFWIAGMVGAAGAYYYTNRRISLKYRALGDLTVFLLMGPVMVWIGTWAIAGWRGWIPFVAALPPAFMVALILHGNNMRDIGVDTEAGVDTLARRLGFRRSKTFFGVLLLLAYGSVPLLVVAGYAPWWVLLALISLPPALRLQARVAQATDGAELMDLPMRSAQLHLIMGVLYTAGFGLGGVLG
ncbi:MAG: prenyltransferase [Alkalispirochaeta sp.]